MSLAIMNNAAVIIYVQVFMWMYVFIGLPRWHSGKESPWECRRLKRQGFDLWVGRIPWRRKWQPTPVFLPGKFHGQRSLVLWGCKESDTTEHAHTHIFITLESIPSNQIAESHGNSMCKLLRNYQTVSQGWCGIFPSQKQCIRVPVSPCPKLFICFCCWATLM